MAAGGKVGGLDQEHRGGARYRSVKRMAGTAAVKAFLWTLSARGLSAGGALALAVVIGRLIGGEAFGIFSFFNALLIGAGIFARTGTDRALIRYAAAYRDLRAQLFFLHAAARRTVVNGSLLTIAMIVLLFLPTSFLNGYLEFHSAIVFTSLTVLPFSLSMVLSGFLKGVFRPVAGTLQENGVISLLAATLLIADDHIGETLTLYDAFLWYAVSAWCVLLLGGLQVVHWSKRVRRAELSGKNERQDYQRLSRNEFMSASRHYAHMTLVVYLQSFVAVLLLGFYLTPLDLGAFKAAEKITVAIVFVLVVINALFAPRFARAHSEGDTEKLRHLFRISVFVGALVALVPFLSAVVFPQHLMSFVGEEYRSYSAVLVVVASAQFVNVLFGPVGTVLNMCGDERFVKRVLVGVSVSSFVAYPLAILAGDVVGVACAYLVAVIAQNGLCGIRLRKIFGDGLVSGGSKP